MRAAELCVFKPVPFLADLTIALTAAYFLSLGVDRLVFAKIREPRA